MDEANTARSLTTKDGCNGEAVARVYFPGESRPLSELPTLGLLIRSGHLARPEHLVSYLKYTQVYQHLAGVS